MNDKILLPTDGLEQTNIVAIVWNESAQVYNVSTNNFESWVDSNIGTYGIPAVEQGTSGIYLLTLPPFPSSLAGYSGMYFERIVGPTIVLDDVRKRPVGTFGKSNGAVNAPSVSSIGVTEVRINDL